jgi:branched-subunit amino acid aminotransferase/4-amino-4-deoxychorismate lyase
MAIHILIIFYHNFFSNYAPTIMVAKLAADYGCQQVLWLSGRDHKLTEVGAMNIFVYWKNEQGGWQNKYSN